MDDDGVLALAQLRRTLPDLFHERTRGVVRLHVHALLLEALGHLHRGAKRRNNHHVLWPQVIHGMQGIAQRVLQEAHATALQVRIDFRVVDHLAQQKHVPPRVFVNRLVADLNRVLHAKAKPKVTRQLNDHGPEVEDRRRKILLPCVLRFAFGLHPRDDGAPVKFGNVKTAHGSKIPSPTKPSSRVHRSFHQPRILKLRPNGNGLELHVQGRGNLQGGFGLLLHASLLGVASLGQPLGAVKCPAQGVVPQIARVTRHVTHVTHNLHIAGRLESQLV